MRVLISILSAIAVLATAVEAAQTSGVMITTSAEREERAREQLERILETYDLEPWLFTREVQIQESVIPHSHPVLTVNTRYIDDENDYRMLTTLVHEQFHWFADEHEAQIDAAKTEFRELFPEVPVRGGEGARDEESTYLHLVVCDLELQAMTDLVGEAVARDVLSRQRHYTWIYDKVLNDTRIREINVRHGLVVPPRTSD